MTMWWLFLYSLDERIHHSVVIGPPIPSYTSYGVVVADDGIGGGATPMPAAL
jgi:hypothetical protein